MTKTENDLDARFQWHEGLDPDHIFPDELTMIQDLRSHIPQLGKESDKFVAVFLFARRHNMHDTTELLKQFFTKKEAYANYFAGCHNPSYSHTNGLGESVKKGAASMIQPKGYRDKKGRFLRYFMMGKDFPSQRTLEYTYVNFIWATYYTIAVEPLSVWRNGMAIIVDLKGAGLRNLDISSKGREIHSAMQGTFPFRVRSMLVVNGGLVIETLVSAAMLALPKKLMDRIKIIKQQQLLDFVPTEYLFPEFGGTSKAFTFDDFYDEILKTEEQLYAKGIWKYHDGATPATL